ncbi:MAG TPA: holo-ACP synthase [Terriglobales bacterium]|jgi:holo-[acyl-carrier protein] synthase|nr:holo-ACP synthase [Terriglobales bacterium]
MIIGTGIDIVEVPRISASIERFGVRFTTRIFTDAEIRYCESKANADERFAVRFAAKEAAMKAIGTGWRGGITWHDFEVQRAAGGRPTIVFSGVAGKIADRMGMRRASLSLSHTAQHAIAQVILED